MTIINNNSISNIDSSLNSYRTYIEAAKTAASAASADYESEILPSFEAVKTKKGDISAFLQGLTFTQMPTSDDITNMDISYSKFYSDLQKSNIINKKLKNITTKYEINEAQLQNAKQTKTYTVLMVWIIIFMFVGSALFMSVIEDKKDLNIFSKIILFLFLFVVLFYVVKNLLTYIK